MIVRRYPTWFVVLGSICLATLGAGCAGGRTVQETARVKRVPEETLRQHGLETVWFFPPDSADTPVTTVELFPQGLFIATQPMEKKPGRLKLLSRTSGSPEWFVELKYPLKYPPSVYQYPQGVTGKPNEVYFTQLDTVHCLDLRYGDELWAAELPFAVSTRVVADEFRYFAGSDTGRAYSIRKKSASEEWTYRTGNRIQASPVVQGDSVFIASTDGSAYRLLSVAPGWITGSSWQRATGSRILGDPVPFSRWVLVGSSDYKLYCLEAQDGTPFWAFPAEAPIEDTPVVYSFRSNQEFAYCVTVQRTPRAEKRTLFSLKLKDGSEMWRRTGIRKVVSLGRRSLYVINDPAPGEGRFLIALDVMNGEEQFRIPADGFDFIPINSADSGRDTSERGRVYMVAQDGTIQVIGERT